MGVQLHKFEVLRILKDVVDVERIVEIKIQPGTKKGDGFLSLITKVDLVTTVPYNFIIKSAPREEKLRKSAPIRLCFQQEIYFYNTVLPALLNFQQTHCISDSFLSIPKCFKSSSTEGMELLVLNNMKEQGFTMLDHRFEMDENHISLVLEQYGKFHATSFAFKDHYPAEFRKLESGVQKVFNCNNFPDLFNAFRICAEKLKEIFDPIDDQKVYNKLLKFEKSLPELFEMIENDGNEHKIFLHGDCWSNNILFRYEDPDRPSKPTKVCFLDFQLLRMSSPMMDISHFLSMSAPKRILDQLDHYLQIYHKSFSNHLKSLGSNPEKLYPFSTLKQDWRTYSKFGFVIALTLLRGTVRDDDEVCDYNDLGETLSLLQIFIRKSKSDETIKMRLTNLVLHMHETGLL